MTESRREGLLVTVGIPVHNGADLLSSCLDAILAQTHQHLEVWISDNGSNDETAAVAARYAAIDDRVHMVSAGRNRGAAWNFNRVLALASGEYFMWAAVDDYCCPEFVARAVARLEEDQSAVICHSEAQPVTASGVPVGSPYLGWTNELESVRDRWLKLHRHPELHAAIYGLMRTAQAQRTRGMLPILASDLVFVSEMCVLGKLVQIPGALQRKRVPEPGARYRSRSQTLEMLGADCSSLGAALVPLRGRALAECVRALRLLEVPWRLSSRLALDALWIYIAETIWLVDLKESVLGLLAEVGFRRGIV